MWGNGSIYDPVSPQLLPTGRPEALAAGNPCVLSLPPHEASCAACPGRAFPCHAWLRAAVAGRRGVLGEPLALRARSGSGGDGRWPRRGENGVSFTYTFAHVETVRGQRRIDLATDPPPDLVLEIDITHPSLDKLPLYAAVGVPEVWRYDGNRVVLYGLTTQGYEELGVSTILAGVTRDALTELIGLSTQLRRATWVRHVQTWAQTHHSGSGN